MRSNDEREATLNQLLVEMDGFNSSENIVVFAATNRHDMLDPALTRPGRFDRIIDITNPDLESRKEIFLVHLKPLLLDLSERTIEDYSRRLATLTPGFSGSDLAAICNEAAILAARETKDSVTSIDFEKAVERIIGGIEMKKSISPEERRTVAYHESGHGVVSWFLEGGNPLLKLTIIPRSKGALGFAQYLPNETSLQTKEELLDQICCILGGRCSEQHFFGEITTGAFDDLQKVYRIAHQMVTKLGMDDEIKYSMYRENEYGNKRYSEETNQEIDARISAIIKQCTERTMNIIKEREHEISLLSEALLEKQTLDLKEITALIGKRPFEPKSTFKEYLKEV